MTEAELDATWKRYWRDRNDEDRNLLAIEFLDYAYSVARRCYPYTDWDERRSATHVSLLKSIGVCDPGKFKSIKHFLSRRIPFDLRDHFYRNKDCPDRAMRYDLMRRKLHDGIPDTATLTPLECTAVWSAVSSVSADDQELVLRTIVGGERLKDIAKEKGCTPETLCYKRKAALQRMRTGNRSWRPWDDFRPGAIRHKMRLGRG
jgi:hypothetical protein